MKIILRILCIVVLLVGTVLFSLAYVGNSEADDVEPAASFVVTEVQSKVNPDGDVTVVAWRTRYVKANGEWRLVMHQPNLNGKNKAAESPIFAGLQEGVFGKAAGASERKSFSQAAPEQLRKSFRSHQFLARHKEFARLDQVAGLKVYVLRTEIKDTTNPQEWVEVSYSPQTGLTPLRNVVHFRDGSEIRIEAISVKFKEVPENLNEDVKALPLKQE